MYNHLKLNINPVSIKSWKKTPPNINRKRLLEEPKKYSYMLSLLINDLEVLKRTIVKESSTPYLVGEFFKSPSELSGYLEDLKKYGLSFVKVSNNGNKVYFRIDSIDGIISYITTGLLYLSDFVNGKINEQDFQQKQIILWYRFYLNTDTLKSYFIKNLKKFNKLRVEFSSYGIKNTEEYLLDLSKTYSNINITVQGDSLDITDLGGGLTQAKEFLKKLSENKNILYLNLDSHFSTTDSPNGLVTINNVAIDDFTQDAPVVAIIDSGITKNLYTSFGLIDEGLDFTVSDPKKGNPFSDLTSHGTIVANEIIYGDSIENYFSEKISKLYPLVKVISIKVFGDEEGFHIDYRRILEEDGDFLKIIKKYNIRVVNISINEVNSKNFKDLSISKNAKLLDDFGVKHDILFVVCTGNIEIDEYKELLNKYPNLEFYSKNFLGSTTDPVDRYINISSPADLLSGITVGGAYKHEKALKRNKVSSYSPSYISRGYSGKDVKDFKKPEVIAIGSGDYRLKKLPSGEYDIGLINAFKTFHLGSDETKLYCATGTSFSAPRVARALAIGGFKYKDFRIETIKGLFIHGLDNNSINKNFIFEESLGDYTGDEISIAEYYSGIALHEGKSEENIFSDDDNKITYIIESSIKSRELKSYEIPIIKLIGDGSSGRRNKLQLKLSIVFQPYCKNKKYEAIHLDEANEFFISGCIHKNNLELLSSKNQFTKGLVKDKSLLLNWTSHYYGGYNKTYSESFCNILKDELLDILGQDDTITLSVRGFNKLSDVSENNFTAIFSVIDLGETNQIRSSVEILITN